jgi:hypothetical protein
LTRSSKLQHSPWFSLRPIYDNESQAIAQDNHLAAKTIQTWNANRKRQADPVYKEGDLVMLNTRNIRKRITRDGPVAKLYPRHIGPFKVIKAFPKASTYKLELLTAVDFESIHNVFHTNLLRPYIQSWQSTYPSPDFAAMSGPLSDPTARPVDTIGLLARLTSGVANWPFYGLFDRKYVRFQVTAVGLDRPN